MHTLEVYVVQLLGAAPPVRSSSERVPRTARSESTRGHEFLNINNAKFAYRCSAKRPSLSWQPSLPLLLQWSMAGVYRQRAGCPAGLVDVPLLERAEPRPRCSEEPPHAGQHRLLQDIESHRTQGGFPLWGSIIYPKWRNTPHTI